MRTIQKKNSSVSLIGRFGRNGRKNSIASNADKFPLPPLPQMPGDTSIPLLPKKMILPPRGICKEGNNDALLTTPGRIWTLRARRTMPVLATGLKSGVEFKPGGPD